MKDFKNFFSDCMTALKETLVRWKVTNEEADEFIEDYLEAIGKFELPSELTAQNVENSFLLLCDGSMLKFHVENN